MSSVDMQCDLPVARQASRALDQGSGSAAVRSSLAPVNSMLNGRDVEEQRQHQTLKAPAGTAGGSGPDGGSGAHLSMAALPAAISEAISMLQQPPLQIAAEMRASTQPARDDQDEQQQSGAASSFGSAVTTVVSAGPCAKKAKLLHDRSQSDGNIMTAALSSSSSSATFALSAVVSPDSAREEASRAAWKTSPSACSESGEGARRRVPC